MRTTAAAVGVGAGFYGISRSDPAGDGQPCVDAADAWTLIGAGVVFGLSGVLSRYLASKLPDLEARLHALESHVETEAACLSSLEGSFNEELRAASEKFAQWYDQMERAWSWHTGLPPPLPLGELG